MNMQGRLSFAAALAQEAGTLARDMRAAHGGLTIDAKGPQDFVTAADLAVVRFPDDLLRMVEERGVDPARLTLEITEQALLGDLDLAARSLGRLRNAGMRIALDDFGAGFCNFGYLKYLPLDFIKLDRIMLDGVAESARDRAVLRAVIAMARALELAVIAEGVEDETQRKIALEEGCSAYQGFLRARPLPHEEFLALASGQA